MTIGSARWWTTLTAVALGSSLAACSPSPAPSAAESTPSATVEQLPRDFLGVTLGAELDAVPCGDDVLTDSQRAPCAHVLGDVMVPPTIVPTGFDHSLHVIEESGRTTEIRAKVDPGALLAAGKLVEKYGPAHHALAGGELQWADGFMHVVYLPPTASAEGMVIMRTRDRQVALDAKRAEEASRSL